jgi:hypothetical protein
MATLGPDEMPDTQWEVVKRYIFANIAAMGKNDADSAFQFMKLKWTVLNDQVQMQRYLDGAELSQLEGQMDSFTLKRPAMEARIQELKDAGA